MSTVPKSDIELTVVREIDGLPLSTRAKSSTATTYRDWLEMLAEDMRYRCPCVSPASRGRRATFILDMAHMDDDWDSLEMRALRVDTEYAWAEDPPSRTRHFITNVRVAAERERRRVRRQEQPVALPHPR